MSVPRLLAQVLFLGTQIVGKAFVEAGRQAARNARAGRVEAGAAAAGASNGAAENLTRTHRMTLDEARQILNIKEVPPASTEASQEELVKAYDRLFTINAPPAPKGKEGGGKGSFYLQSKIVRARERIEAEWEAEKKRRAPPPPPPSGGAEAPKQEASA